MFLSQGLNENRGRQHCCVVEIMVEFLCSRLLMSEGDPWYVSQGLGFNRGPKYGHDGEDWQIANLAFS